MLDAEKLKHLSEEMIYALSASQWIDVSWHNAVDGIVHGQTSILGTENGEWRILCDSLQTVSELLNSGEIIQRIHQQHEMRFLPPLRRIIPVPQARFGSPMAMLRCFPYQKMPDNLWQAFAWKMAVDPKTAESTVVTGIQNGVWRIRCHSDHAWNTLQNPEPIMRMLRWLGTLRSLPEVRSILPILGEIRE